MNIWNNIDTDLDDFFLVGHKRDIWLIIPSCQQSSHLVINKVDQQPQRDFDLAFVHIYQEFKVCVAMVILQSKYGSTCFCLRLQLQGLEIKVSEPVMICQQKEV